MAQKRVCVNFVASRCDQRGWLSKLKPCMHNLVGIMYVYAFVLKYPTRAIVLCSWYELVPYDLHVRTAMETNTVEVLERKEAKRSMVARTGRAKQRKCRARLSKQWPCSMKHLPNCCEAGIAMCIERQKRMETKPEQLADIRIHARRVPNGGGDGAHERGQVDGAACEFRSTPRLLGPAQGRHGNRRDRRRVGPT